MQQMENLYQLEIFCRDTSADVVYVPYQINQLFLFHPAHMETAMETSVDIVEDYSMFITMSNC